MSEDVYSLTDTWRMAIKAEQDAYELYSKMASQSKDPSTRDLFVSMAAEEKKHKQKLEDEYRRVFEADM